MPGDDHDPVAAVARGIAFFDEHYPGWRDRVAWERLDLHNRTTDPIGMIDIDLLRRGRADLDPVAIGVDLPDRYLGARAGDPAGDVVYQRAYAILTFLWKAMARPC